MSPYAAHSALEPAGFGAAESLRLFYAYLDVAAVVFTLVITALGFALGRKRERHDSAQEPSAAWVSSRTNVVTWATAATVVVLIGLLIASVATGHAMALLPAANPVEVDVVGHKWWWEFRYRVTGAATRFSTAYELHVPVGRPVALKLIARDVIHSFWVPSLSGKRDAIPGKDTVLVLRADKPGVYEGQCAEFCGTEHANMRFLVVAQSSAEFDAWKNQQMSAPPPPSDELARRGQEVFMNSRCASCHAIGGTPAFGTVGPDLSHIGSRKRLAMGSLRNDESHLSQWISDPQQTKPGVQMPSTPLAAADMRALIVYLEGLK